MAEEIVTHEHDIRFCLWTNHFVLGTKHFVPRIKRFVLADGRGIRQRIALANIHCHIGFGVSVIVILVLFIKYRLLGLPWHSLGYFGVLFGSEGFLKVF